MITFDSSHSKSATPWLLVQVLAEFAFDPQDSKSATPLDP